jgi:hypothetical protein
MLTRLPPCVFFILEWTDHEDNMHDFSLSEEYCNPATGNWHQTVILGDEHCEATSRLAATEKLVYTRDNCLHGMQLASCRRGECWRTGTEETWLI